MSISFIVMSMYAAFDVYQHSKAFCIALGLPYSNRGKITMFHIVCANLLGFFSMIQNFFSVQIMYMSFYLILSSKEIMQIYTNAAGLLFVNSISKFMGLFFKMWIRAENHEGLEFLKARSHYRAHLEIVAKCIMLATLGAVWYTCLKEWYRNDARVIIYYDIEDSLTRGNRLPVLFIGIALLFSVLAIINFNVRIDDQGLEVDPDEDVDIMIDEQIK